MASRNGDESASLAARQHIEEIRRSKFSIGAAEPNPLTEDLHHAVRNLSAELYSKDVHFLMELIQNAEDNEYSSNVTPTLEFVITPKDITGTGASSTLIVFNNEVGFSQRNIMSICSVGRSTKKGKRLEGFIGEKGIGFKSVFIVTSKPYIFSNGYRISFTEDPDPHCGIGYIVPNWVEAKPTISDIHSVYGIDKTMPTTVVILPLKSEKVNAVKQQLSIVHPEILLFLAKIKRLSVRESKNDTRAVDTVTAISISSETDFRTRKDVNADSHIVYLSSKEGTDRIGTDCHYYIWRQRFPVKHEHMVEVRRGVHDWVISLAFPFGERLRRGTSSAGIYAFLPTEMVTNFPFIIQADFILASSRETILLDSKWNKGILDCVPDAFVNAFVACVKSVETAPMSSVAPTFKSLPVKTPSYDEFGRIRETIGHKLQDEFIIPCESFSDNKVFGRPRDVGRLLPTFRDILFQFKQQEVPLKGISSHGKFILHSAMELSEYNDVMNFLGITYLDNDWYGKCIRCSNLILQASEDLYVELLFFLSENWYRKFEYSTVKNLLALKYVDPYNKVATCSFVSAADRTKKIFFAKNDNAHAWLNKWNVESRCTEMVFLPNATQMAVQRFRIRDFLNPLKLGNVTVDSITAYSYAKTLLDAPSDSNRVIFLTHFLCQSLAKKFISESEAFQICRSMPIVDRKGHKIMTWKAALLPATGSRWVELLGSNPWIGEQYVELGEAYAKCGSFAGEYTSKEKLLEFVKLYIGAKDLPELLPPDAALPSASIGLSKEKAFLLLDWLRFCRSCNLPQSNKCITSIKDGMWLKTREGYNSPDQCLLPNEELESFLIEMGLFSACLPMIDEQFYDNKVLSYMSELQYIGVKFSSSEAFPVIARILLSIGKFKRLTRKAAVSLLKFIRCGRQRCMLPDAMIRELQNGIFLKTSQGYRPAIESIFLLFGTEPFLQITALPFVDETYYGEDIRQYKLEFSVLGIGATIEEAYELIVKKCELPSKIPPLTKEVAISLLKFIGYLMNKYILTYTSQDLEISASSWIKKIKSEPWLKTNIGFVSPPDSLLSHPEWGCMLDVIHIPVVDKNYYNDEIQCFKSELQLIGVLVDFACVTKVIASRLKTLSSSFSLTKSHILSLLSCIKCLKGTPYSPLEEFKTCLSNEKWLKTHRGYNFATDTVLFDSTWEPISQIAYLPFLDDDFYGNCINLYKNELKLMGVAVDLVDGVQLLVRGLKLPEDASNMTAASVLSLLQCVRHILAGKYTSLLDDTLRHIGGKWLKTCMGYRSPEECFLYDFSINSGRKKWASILERKDAPFLDEEFYGNDICLYKNELKAIGVKVDAGEGSAILADILTTHTRFPAIKRIYKYLYKYNWKPQLQTNSTICIWIPARNKEGGEWVDPSRCVLSSNDDLFESRLHVLDKYYDKSLLPFFSSTFGVNSLPSTNDYITLWNDWEGDPQHYLSTNECCAFWAYILDVWNASDAEIFTKRIKMLPAKGCSDAVLLVDKTKLFIADDLQLEHMFSEASVEPLFVWYPQPSVASIALIRLYKVYMSLGVTKISCSVQKGVDSCQVDPRIEMVELKNMLIGEGLQRLILGYLADPHLEISAKVRHRITRTLADLHLYETKEPITVSYNLTIPFQRRNLSVKETKMVRWEKDSNRLIVWKQHMSDLKSNIEFTFHFARAVSEGLLWEHPDHVEGLYKLLKLGCAYGFEMDKMETLLKMENLQVLPEDEKFLSSTIFFDKAHLGNSSTLSLHRSHKRKSKDPDSCCIVTRSHFKRGCR